MTNDHDTVTRDKDNLHGFIHEFSIVAGAGAGSVIALQRLTKSFTPADDGFLTQFSATPAAGYLLFGGIALGVPILANIITGKEWNECYNPSEEHEASRIKGIYGGALFTLAIAFNTLVLPPIIEKHNDTIVQLAEMVTQNVPSLNFRGI